MNKYLILFMLTAINLPLSAQISEIKEFLPKDRLFEIPYLDPNEALAYGTFAAWWKDGVLQEKAYMPISFGFYKPIIRWNKKRRVEFGIDAAAHFQFEWLLSDSIVQRNLLNTDYKFSFNLAFELDSRNYLRLRAYHVSSHFGDDYMIRNNMDSYFPNPNNYEQFDALWMNRWRGFQNYVGAGLVIRPETIRKRFSGMLGSTFDLPIHGSKPRGIAGGVNLKLLQETNFYPSVKLALGIRVGALDRLPFRFMVELYNGHIPYSPLEYQQIRWFGAGLYFSPG